MTAWNGKSRTSDGLCPQERLIGIADGARSNWNFLAPHANVQILDYLPWNI
jgi:hypothetical protein